MNQETAFSREPDQIWSPSPVEIRTVVLLLWQRKWVIVFSFVTAMIAANFYLMKQAELFTAQAEVMLNNRETQIVDLKNVVSELSNLDDSANEQRILTSERLLTRLVDRLRLDLDPEFNPALGQESILSGWRDQVQAMLADGMLAPLLATRHGDDLVFSAEQDRLRIMDAVRASLKIAGVHATRAITIEVRSVDPEKAALIANTLADLYILDQLDQKFEATKRASSWLGDRITQLEEKVKISEAAIEAFKAKQAVGSGQGADLTDLQIAELNTELITARAATAKAAARFDQVQRRINQGGFAAASTVVSSPLVLTLRTRLSDLQRQEAELATRYGDKHPKIINVRAEIKDARGGVAAEVRKIVESLKNDVAVARAREGALASSLSELEDKSVLLSRSSVELRQLEREADADRLIYETFLSRYRETSEQEDLQAPDARLLTSATAPLAPSSPNRKKVFVIAAVLGLGIGLALVGLLESMAKTFRAVIEVNRATGLPVLASIPRWKRRRTRQQLLKQVRAKPNSALAEAIRTLRTSLFLSQVDQPPRVIMVTSSGAEEGKSTTCLLLAQLAQQAGQKAIVVDCDIRRPTLHQTISPEPVHGLLSVLDNTAGLEDAIVSDPVTGIDLLPAPKALPQAVDVFSSDRFKAIIDEMRGRYDLILLDTPPIMMVPDAGIIGQAADIALYAIRFDHTHRQSAIDGIDRLRSLGLTISGAIVTLVEPRREAKYASAAYDAGHAPYIQRNLYITN